jgi:hypothetical protein
MSTSATWNCRTWCLSNDSRLVCGRGRSPATNRLELRRLKVSPLSRTEGNPKDSYTTTNRTDATPNTTLLFLPVPFHLYIYKDALCWLKIQWVNSASVPYCRQDSKFQDAKCHQIRLRNNHPPDLNNLTCALCLSLSLPVDKWLISPESAEYSSRYRSWRYQQVWNSQFDESIEVQASWLVNNHQTNLFPLTKLILFKYNSCTIEHLNKLRWTW